MIPGTEFMDSKPTIENFFDVLRNTAHENLRYHIRGRVFDAKGVDLGPSELESYDMPNPAEYSINHISEDITETQQELELYNSFRQLLAVAYERDRHKAIEVYHDEMLTLEYIGRDDYQCYDLFVEAIYAIGQEFCDFDINIEGYEMTFDLGDVQKGPEDRTILAGMRREIEDSFEPETVSNTSDD